MNELLFPFAEYWWFYLAFPAGRVVIVDPFEDGFAHGFEP